MNFYLYSVEVRRRQTGYRRKFIMRTFIICTKYSLRMAKSNRLRWTGHVARMGKINAYEILVGKLKGRDQEIKMQME
jgi:hypothetical protein